MKYILSFFMLILFLCSFFPLRANDSAIEKEITGIAGIAVNTDFFDARLFLKADDILTSSIPSLHSWSVEYAPFSFLKLSLGSLTYSGVWSRFNNPSPTKIAPTKQAFSIQNRLLSSLPTKGSSKKPASASVNLTLPFLKLHAYSAINPSENYFSGIGISAPFSFMQDTVTGTVSSSWKMVKIKPKEYNSWFRNSTYFVESFFHTFIQEISIKLPMNIFLFSTGLTQMPSDKPAHFFRLDYSFLHHSFLLNTQVFLCDIDYLGQNGSAQRDTIQLSVNPQLIFKYTGLLRELTIGASSNLELRNGTNFFQNKVWAVSFALAFDAHFIFMSVQTTASIDNLFFEKFKPAFQLVSTKDTIFSIKSKTTFYPWYLKKLKRSWNIKALYEKKPNNNYSKGTIQGELALNMDIPAAFAKNLGLSFSGDIDCNLDKKNEPLPIAYKASCFMALESNIFNYKQKASANAQIELQTQGLVIKKIDVIFSVLIEM